MADLNEFLEDVEKTVEENSENKNVELTEQQKFSILNLWNIPNKKPTLKESVEVAWGPGIDVRSQKGIAVRKFIASRQLKPVLAQEERKEKPELTEDQKDFIRRNAGTKGPYQISKELFGQGIQPASIMVRTVAAFISELPTTTLYVKPLPNCTEEYSPPVKLTEVVPKVNEYANPEKKLVLENLTSTQKRQLYALIGYMHNKRFLFQIKTYDKEEDRILFESCFMKWTYDKADLTQEDVDQYIMLAIEVVSSHSIQRTIKMFQKEQDDLVANGEKMSMNLVEAISVARKEFDSSSKRQSDLLKSLTQKRSDRLSKQIKENATILNLVNYVKEQESRQKVVAYNQLRAKKLKEEIDKYVDMSELKIKILGIGVDEIISG